MPFPFHLEWARELWDHRQRRGVAFFLKQLGGRPIERVRELDLSDSHGGNWAEWQENLRVREVPGVFMQTRLSYSK